MKRGSLSQEEKEFIEQNRNLSVEEMSKDLDRSVGIIAKHIETLPDEQPEKVERSLFDRSLGRTDNATVMTPGASEISDVKARARKENSGKKKNSRQGNHIYKMR